MIIIGITGTLGAGKGTVVEYLKRTYGFSHFSARDFIVTEIEKRGMPVNRDTMTLVANDLRATHHSAYIVEQMYLDAVKQNQNTIIESIRTVGEVEMMKGKPQFYLFAVTANAEDRYKRIKERKSATDMISFDKFLADEEREMESTDPGKQNLTYCIEHADYVFTNESTLDQLHAQVNEVMKKLIS